VLAATVVVLVVSVVVVRIAIGGVGAPRTDAADASGASCATGAGGGSCSSAATGPGPTQPLATSIRPRSATPSPSASPRPARTTMAPTAPVSAPSPGGTTSPDAAAADAVLALINQARAQASLPAYTITSGLELSSNRHNQLMADGCGLSHQCPGEPPLGARETEAGVQWTAAGENIGEGGPVADTSGAITQMAVALTQDMINEKPPDDGHRLNILSSTFTHIGIAVELSPDGTVWMTQDFSN